MLYKTQHMNMLRNTKKNCIYSKHLSPSIDITLIFGIRKQFDAKLCVRICKFKNIVPSVLDITFR